MSLLKIEKDSNQMFFLNEGFSNVSNLLLMRGLLEGGFSRFTMLWITRIEILSYHDLAFL